MKRGVLGRELHSEYLLCNGNLGARDMKSGNKKQKLEELTGSDSY